MATKSLNITLPDDVLQHLVRAAAMTDFHGSKSAVIESLLRAHMTGGTPHEPDAARAALLQILSAFRADVTIGLQTLTTRLESFDRRLAQMESERQRQYAELQGAYDRLQHRLPSPQTVQALAPWKRWLLTWLWPHPPTRPHGL